MKMSKLALPLLAGLLAAPLALGLATADGVEAGESPALEAGTIPGTNLASVASACGAAPSQNLPLFQASAFPQPPTGCYSCESHSECRSYCGGFGSCFPDTTFTCSSSSFDRFCFC